MVMLMGSKIIFWYVDWWSIVFLLLCSTKFPVGGSLPVQENEDLLKEREDNLHESENDLQKSYNDNQESEKDLQEADGNFEVQPRSLVLFSLLMAKIFGKRMYRNWKHDHDQAKLQQSAQNLYPPYRYPPAQYPPPPQYGGYPPPTYYPAATYKPPRKSH